MDTSLLGGVKEIGIGLAALVGSGVILKIVIDKGTKLISDLMLQLQENRKDYSNFVESNNHQNSERIEASTVAMTEVANAIQQHTKVLERIVDRLNK